MDEEAGKAKVVGWLAAANFLGCSKAQVRRLVAQSRLRSEVDESGRHRFEQAELASLRVRRRPPGKRVGALGEAATEREPAEASPTAGEVDARVFSDLENGKLPVQIVIDHKIEAERVHQLIERWRQFKAMVPDLPVPASRLAEIEQGMRALAKRVEDVQTYCQNVYWRLTELPFLPPRSFQCPECGKKGAVNGELVCAGDGRHEMAWTIL